MDYLLILLLALTIQCDAEEKTSETRRITHDDSFNVNIGAGYGVGPDQSTDTLPRSTTKIVHTRDRPSNELSQNAFLSPRVPREPKILTNFTPINTVSTAKKSQNRIYDFTNFDNSPSDDFENNKINSYQVHESFSDSDKHTNGRPNLIQLQKVINGVDKPNSRIVEVIKVPAVYEIHVQTDTGKGNHKDISENINNENLDIKTYGKHKPIFRGFSTQFSDDYIKWLKEYYKKKEEEYLKENEEFKEQYGSTVPDFHDSFSDTPPEWNDEHLQHDNVLDPVLAHHYKHIGSFENKRDKNGVHHNSKLINKLRYAPWEKENRPYDKDILYGTHNLKRDAGVGGAVPGLNSYKSSPASLKNEFVQRKKLLGSYKIDNKLDTVGKYGDFRRNQEITEFNQPQALHEVPAPYLGKYPRPKAFEENSPIKSDEFMPQQKNDHIRSQSTYNTFPTSIQIEKNKLTSGSFYNQIKSDQESFKTHGSQKSEVVSSTDDFVSSLKRPQDFIYGKRTESVLAPGEIHTSKNLTNQQSSTYADNYRRFYLKDDLGTNAFQNNKSNTGDERQCTNCEDSIYQLASPNPETSTLRSQNVSSLFSKKSDNSYNTYQKKDVIFDDNNKMDFPELSKPMMPVYKNSFYSIYPKKVSEGKKNLFQNIQPTDFDKNVVYSYPFNENKLIQSFKNKNQSKPLGYVIYITKKSTEKK